MEAVAYRTCDVVVDNLHRLRLERIEDEQDCRTIRHLEICRIAQNGMNGHFEFSGGSEDFDIAIGDVVHLGDVFDARYGLEAPFC